MKLLLNLLMTATMLGLSSCTHMPKPESPFVIGNEYSITGNGAFWKLEFDGEIEKREGPLQVKILELRPPDWARVVLIDEDKPPFWMHLEDTNKIEKL